MRKFLATTALATTALAAAVLAACGSGGGDGGDQAGGAGRTDPADERADRTGASTTTVPAHAAAAEPVDAPPPASADRTTTTITAGPAPAPPRATTTVTPPTAAPSGTRYVCPDGGIDAVRELQAAIDEGHQPWRLSAEQTAAACTFPTGAVEPAGGGDHLVTDPATGDTVLVEMARPLGPGTVWAVTRVTPA